MLTNIVTVVKVWEWWFGTRKSVEGSAGERGGMPICMLRERAEFS